MTKKTIETTCVEIDDFGRGIVRIDGTTCFIDDLLPGEKALITTIFEYGRLKDAYIEKRLTSSPHRVTPLCPHYPSCGGCQLLHLDYPSQLIYKTKKVKFLLHKFAHLDIEVEKTLGVDNPTRFRNKVQKPVRMNYRKRLPAAGFYEKDTHRLIEVEDCLMETELSSKITNAVLDLMVDYNYLPFDEDRMTGLVRHVLIKTSSFYKNALVTLVVTKGEVPGRLNFAKDLIKRCPEVSGVVFNVNYRHTNVILGEQDIPIYGHQRIVDKIFGRDFLISTQSFYQTNPSQIETLYGTAIELAGLEKTDRVLDAYCGTGTIGLSLSDKVKEVVGVEIVPSAVHDAITNAKINKIKNAHFIKADCTDYLLSTDDKYDVIFMDPPRKGSTPEFLDAVKRIAPRTLIYISCDPVTLSRDLNLLKDTFEIEKVVPVDMFPNTTHVETVALLVLKDFKK